MSFHEKAKEPTLPTAMNNKVLLLIDWENLFMSLYHALGMDKMQVEHRIKGIIEWIKKDLGGLLGNYGFLFAPGHLSIYHQAICARNNLKLIICPKRHLTKPKRNNKTGKLMFEEDTVDENIIWFAETLVDHSHFKIICLVAGDNDYVPLFEELGQLGIKRALAVPTIDSLSKTKKLVNLVDKHPETHKKMILRVDQI